MAASRLFSNVFTLGISNILRLILGFLIFIVLARVFTPAEVGIFVVAQAYAAIAMNLAAYGSHTVVGLEIAKLETSSKQGVSEIFLPALLLVSLSSLIVAGLLAGLFSWVLTDVVDWDLFVPLCFFYFSISIGILIEAVFRGLRDSKPILVPRLVGSVLITIVLFSTFFLQPSLKVFALLLTLSQVIATVIIFALLLNTGLVVWPDNLLTGMRRVLKRCAGIGSELSLYYLGNNLCNVVMPIYLRPEAVALFNSSFKLLNISSRAYGFLLSSLLPYISAVQDDSEACIPRIHLLGKFLFISSAPFIITVIIWGADLSVLLFGDYYAATAPYVSVLGIYFFVEFLPPMAEILRAIGKEWYVFRISLIKFAFNLVLLFALVPFFGISGAVHAYGISCVAYYLVGLLYLQKLSLRPFAVYSSLIRYCLPTFLSGYLLMNVHFSIGIPIFLLLSCVLFPFLLFERSEWSLVINRIDNKHLNRLAARLPH